MPVGEEEDDMSEDEALSSDMSSVAVRVYAEDDSMSEDEADGEESREEAAEKEMDAGADETKAEEMDAEPEANGGADAEKTKVEAADAKVEAEEQAAEAGGEIEEDGADSDDEGEGSDAVEESPPTSPPARSSRSRKRAATPDPVTKDDEEEETPLPPRRRRRRRRKSGEGGESSPPLPDNLRCRRSDGKKWRCVSRALPTVSFCEYHYAKASKCKKPPAHGEILAEALQRLKTNKRKGRKRLNLTPESPKATKDLPNGFMTTSQGSSGAVGSPVMTKVVPCAMSKAKEAQMSCHRCGLKKVARVVKCNNCEINCFCNRCINKWYYGISRKDMKMKCPVCRGTCDCKRCILGPTKGAIHKESPGDLGSSGAVCSPVMTKVEVDSVQANDYSIKGCISVLTATTLAPDEKIKAAEVFQTLAYRETFLSFNETDPEIALLWLRGKVDKL